MKNNPTDSKFPPTMQERVRMMVQKSQPSIQAQDRLRKVGNLAQVETEPVNPELNPQTKPDSDTAS